MLPTRRSTDDDVCPVGDAVLGELYRASKLGLPVLVETVAPDVRAMLALFCYRRSHMHAMSLAIAATCTEYDLVQLGGTVGAVLFARSREEQVSPTPPPHSNRRKITLASGLLRPMAPLPMDELDELDAADEIEERFDAASEEIESAPPPPATAPVFELVD